MANSGLIWAATVPADGAAFYGAALGTTLPTDATTSLDGDFEDHGWIGEKGVANAPKRTTTKHKAWGGEVVKITQDDYEETIVITFLENNPQVLRTVFGADNVDVWFDGDGHRLMAVEHSSLTLPRMSYVINAIDGVKKVRTVLREAQMTEVGTINQVHDDMWMYECTFDIFKTSAGDPGVVQYFDEPDVFAGS